MRLIIAGIGNKEWRRRESNPRDLVYQAEPAPNRPHIQSPPFGGLCLSTTSTSSHNRASDIQ